MYCLLHDIAHTYMHMHAHTCIPPPPTHTHTPHTQLISDALNSLVHGPEFEDHESLTGRITALHIVYHSAKPKVFWFGQLVSHLPGTMTALEDKVPHDGSEMV